VTTLRPERGRARRQGRARARQGPGHHKRLH